MKNAMKMLVLTESNEFIPDRVITLMNDPEILKKAKEAIMVNPDWRCKNEDQDRILHLASRSLIADIISKSAEIVSCGEWTVCNENHDKIIQTSKPHHTTNFTITKYINWCSEKNSTIEFAIVEFYEYSNWILTEDMYGAENIQIVKLRNRSSQSDIEERLVHSNNYKFSTRLSNEF